jgi:hypothetical protein
MDNQDAIDFDRFPAPEEEPEFMPRAVAAGLRRRAVQARRMGGEWHLALADELEEAAAGLEASAVDAHGVGAVEALGQFSREVMQSYRRAAGSRWMVRHGAGLKTWLAVVTMAMAGYSQAEIAQCLGFSKAAICQLLKGMIESGSPLAVAVKKISAQRRPHSADQRETGFSLALSFAESRGGK